MQVGRLGRLSFAWIVPVASGCAGNPEGAVPPEPPPMQAPAPPREPTEPAGSTPASSLASRPGFASADAGYAPQPGSASALFLAASAAENVSETSGLVCEISSGSFGDDFGGAPDPHVLVRGTDRGEAFTLRAYGPDDVTEMHFVVPLVHPRRGDTLSVTLFDRDVFSTETVEELAARLDSGSRWVAKGRFATLECHPLPAALIEKQVERSSPAADQAVAAMARIQPNLRASELGLGFSGDMGLHLAEVSIGALAGLVGWDDPRVKRRVDEVLAQRGRIVGEIGRAVSAVWDTLPSATTAAQPMADGALAVRVLESGCGQAVIQRFAAAVPATERRAFEAHGCAVWLAVENRSGLPMEIGSVEDHLGPLEHLRWISKKGAVAKVRLFGEVLPAAPKPGDTGKPFSTRRATTIVVPAGQAASVLVVPEGDSVPPELAGPGILRVAHDERWTATPGEWVSMGGGAAEVRVTKLVCGKGAAAIEKAMSPGQDPMTSKLAPGCVMHVEVRRTGAVDVGVVNGGLFPVHRLRLHPAQAFVPPKEGEDGWDYATRGSGGLMFWSVLGEVSGGREKPLTGEIQVPPGGKRHVAVSSGPSIHDDKSAGLTLSSAVLEGDFDAVYGFLRLE